jgi:hypothetical protein
MRILAPSTDIGRIARKAIHDKPPRTKLAAGPAASIHGEFRVQFSFGAANTDTRSPVAMHMPPWPPASWMNIIAITVKIPIAASVSPSSAASLWRVIVFVAISSGIIL